MQFFSITVCLSSLNLTFALVFVKNSQINPYKPVASLPLAMYRSLLHPRSSTLLTLSCRVWVDIFSPLFPSFNPSVCSDFWFLLGRFLWDLTVGHFGFLTTASCTLPGFGLYLPRSACRSHPSGNAFEPLARPLPDSGHPPVLPGRLLA